jgi:probable phosphoglycerate mutase
VIPVALMRHAPTQWNRERRLQGRADIPLLPESRATLGRRRVPQPYAGWRAIASPLQRCVETAHALGLRADTDARLVEMDWGDYQGFTIDELAAKHGDGFSLNEQRGLDMQPPGGESPRLVQTRIAPLLAELAAARRPTLLITHRGVIRALYARAIGWDMTGEPPHRLDLYGLQVFALASDGRPVIERLNVALGWR